MWLLSSLRSSSWRSATTIKASSWRLLLRMWFSLRISFSSRSWRWSACFLVAFVALSWTIAPSEAQTATITPPVGWSSPTPTRTPVPPEAWPTLAFGDEVGSDGSSACPPDAFETDNLDPGWAAQCSACLPDGYAVPTSIAYAVPGVGSVPTRIPTGTPILAVSSTPSPTPTITLTPSPTTTPIPTSTPGYYLGPVSGQYPYYILWANYLANQVSARYVAPGRFVFQPAANNRVVAVLAWIESFRSVGGRQHRLGFGVAPYAGYAMDGGLPYPNPAPTGAYSMGASGGSTGVSTGYSANTEVLSVIPGNATQVASVGNYLRTQVPNVLPWEAWQQATPAAVGQSVYSDLYVISDFTDQWSDTRPFQGVLRVQPVFEGIPTSTGAPSSTPTATVTPSSTPTPGPTSTPWWNGGINRRYDCSDPVYKLPSGPAVDLDIRIQPPEDVNTCFAIWPYINQTIAAGGLLPEGFTLYTPRINICLQWVVYSLTVMGFPVPFDLLTLILAAAFLFGILRFL